MIIYEVRAAIAAPLALSLLSAKNSLVASAELTMEEQRGGPLLLWSRRIL